MFENIAYQCLIFLGPALLLGLGWCIMKLKSLISAKVGNEMLKGMLSRLGEASETAVKSVFQAFVDPLKKEGGFGDKEKAIAKQMAIAEMKSYLGPKGLEELMKILGWKKEEVDSNLASKVEASIDSNKK